MNTLKRCLGMVLMVAVLSPMVSAAEDNGIETLRKTSKAFTEVAKKAVPAVVAVQVEQEVQSDMDMFGNSPFDDEFFRRFFGPRSSPRNSEPRIRRGQGSGFIISADGYILTNNHVVDSADKITVVMKDGRKLDAKVIGTDPDSDVAVIKVEGKDFPAIELGDSDSLEIGEWVIAVGNPFGLAETVTVGVVSAKGRQVGITEGGYEDFIQTDAAINPGNSGGALVDLDGALIGVPSQIESGSGSNSGVGFAIPSATVSQVVPQLISAGKVERSYLGITGGTLTPDIASALKLKAGQQGILIASVVAGAPADKAGLKAATFDENGNPTAAGDIITGIDGKPVARFEDLLSYLYGSTHPGQAVTLDVLRDGKELQVAVTLGTQPAN